MRFWLSIALVSPLMAETILSQKSSRVSFNSTPGLEADYEEDEEEWEGEHTTSLPISAGGSGRAASSVGSNTNGSSVKISTKRFLSKITSLDSLILKGLVWSHLFWMAEMGGFFALNFFSSLTFQNSSDRALSHLSRSFPLWWRMGLQPLSFNEIHHTYLRWPSFFRYDPSGVWCAMRILWFWYTCIYIACRGTGR